MTIIIGLDPGPMVGACLLRLPPAGGRTWYAEIAQISANGLGSLMAGWLEGHDIAAIAAEDFVTGNISARVNAPEGSAAARTILGRLSAVSLAPGAHRLILRRAIDVKPWATDARLDAAGLLAPTKGMRHARDAARHALYSACRDFGARVPRTGATA